MTISEEIVTSTVVSLEQLFPENTQQFLRPFEDIVSTDIHVGMRLDFEIEDRTKGDKKSPILRLARPEDAEDIVEIYQELYEGTYPYKEMEDVDEVRGMIESEACDWVVFKDVHDNTMGCFTFMLDFEDKKGYIRGLMIKKAYQGSVDVVKAVIGSYIGMYTKYKDRIFRWYCENRTAHSKSQFALSIGGIRPLAFYPNKDIFLGKVESDILHICYDQRAITTLRYDLVPTIIPEVANCFLYSTQRYNLGSCKFDNSELGLNKHKIRQLRKRFRNNVERDPFGYETVRFTFDGSKSYFEFLYTPQIQNFEKTSYKVESLEELYVFVEKFMGCVKDWGIRYCEVFLSAYKPAHQRVFHTFGLGPRGYLPSWKYSKSKASFKDYILFNYFEGQISPEIQLIDEGKRLLDILGIQYVFEPKRHVQKISPVKEKILQVWENTKIIKSSFISGFILYLLLLFMGMGVAYGQGYNIVVNTISQLGTFQMTPYPFLFDISSTFAGFTTVLFNLYLFKKIELNGDQKTRLVCGVCKIPQYALFLGAIGIVMVGVFSIDRAFGIWHDIFSGIAFAGFIISLLGVGLILIRFETNFPRYVGLGGFLPAITFLCFCVFPCPLLEWILLFSIHTALIPLYIWLAKN
jgi:hypothetical protein